MDFKAISKTCFHKIKSSTGIKTKFGKKFEEYNPFGYGQDAEYEFMFFNKPLAIMDFKKWIENIPLKRAGTTDDIANTCLYLSTDMSSYVTGQVLSVCGGMLT